MLNKHKDQKLTLNPEPQTLQTLIRAIPRVTVNVATATCRFLLPFPALTPRKGLRNLVLQLLQKDPGLDFGISVEDLNLSWMVQTLNFRG